MGKTRPAAVVNPPSIGRLALRIVVPVTGWEALITRMILKKCDPGRDP